jgi:hypothetical protein
MNDGVHSAPGDEFSRTEHVFRSLGQRGHVASCLGLPCVGLLNSNQSTAMPLSEKLLSTWIR